MTARGDRPGTPARPSAQDAWLPPGERVLLRVKPSPLAIVLRSLGLLSVLLALALLVMWARASLADLAPIGAVALGGLTAAALVLIWNVLDWLNRSYALTERRLLAVSGVLSRRVYDTPLDRVQSVGVYRSLAERLLGLGTIGVASAGTGSYEQVWVMLARPASVLGSIRSAVSSMPGKVAGEGSS